MPTSVMVPHFVFLYLKPNVPRRGASMSKTLSLQRSSGVFILVLNYTGAVFTVLLDVFVLGTRWASLFARSTHRLRKYEGTGNYG